MLIFNAFLEEAMDLICKCFPICIPSTIAKPLQKSKIKNPIKDIFHLNSGFVNGNSNIIAASAAIKNPTISDIIL